MICRRVRLKMDYKKIVRIAGGVAAIIAGVLMIIAANMIIAKYTDTFGTATRTDALVIISYFLIATAVLSKLFSVILIAGKKTRYMAIAVIITQLVLMALEIATVVLWTGMSMTIGAIDIIFMIISVAAVILAIVYLVQEMRSSDTDHRYKHVTDNT